MSSTPAQNICAVHMHSTSVQYICTVHVKVYSSHVQYTCTVYMYHKQEYSTAAREPGWETPAEQDTVQDSLQRTCK